MRKIYLIFIFAFTSLTSNAQTISEAAAKGIVLQYAAQAGLSEYDVENFKISAAYKDETTRADLIYIQQTFNQIPINNQFMVLAIKNGSLVSKSGHFLSNPAERSTNSEVPSVLPTVAVQTAFASKKVATVSAIVPLSEQSGFINYGTLGATSENVTAQLIWAKQNDGKTITLCWQITFAPIETADIWLVRIDATTNKFVDEDNLTVYCNWDDPNHVIVLKHNDGEVKNLALPQAFLEKESKATTPVNADQSNIVNGASYRVVPYPAESPLHPGGAHALVTNPWMLAPGNATTLNWHSDGTNYQYSRGNNVWAYHDRTNLNTGDVLRSVTSSTNDPYLFNFTPDYTQPPTQTTPVENQQFNITNLFYWNNILHDLAYNYGFTEVAGNFQANNQGRGGLGNDYVQAEAQDGSGTNNANFGTPVDGSRPRMQMFLWTQTNPGRDGDVDNGIILHEYTHGISNRLTGGPSVTNCLNNSEQMGEGWSDYFSLMGTQNWATAVASDGFNNPRGIGTYVLGQPTTGLGIRPARYTTNFAVNNFTYANLPTVAIHHGVGFVWCTMLWDLTWKLIETDGINPNIFDANGTGGNVVALKLVTEAMKLQACRPGFVDGRNAIIQADQLLYNGVHVCTIREAFARRGLGANASQGSSASVTDGLADFSIPTSVKLTQNVIRVPEGQNIVYTNTVTTCAAITNYLLTDTLPANVTYVSGGNYNASNRVVSFPVNLASGATQTYSFTVNVNLGSYFPPVVLISDVVPGPTGVIPAEWTATTTNANAWTVHNLRSNSAPFSYFAPNTAAAGEVTIRLTNGVALGATPPNFSFSHQYNTESTWDGGVIEISTNGGTIWSDLGNRIIQNGYNSSLRGTGNPLANRPGWSGNSNAFIKTTVDLSSFANQTAMFRFRLGSDDAVGVVGWNIDDILLGRIAEVKMQTRLFNNNGTLVSVSDTITEISGSATCTPVNITSNPANANVCEGSTATFTAQAIGSTPQYQWQLSTNTGGTWTNIANANSASLSIANVTAAMNGNQHRVLVNNSCPSSATSNAATLFITSAAAITANPANVTLCEGGNGGFTVVANGSSLTYQWQVSTNAGVSYVDVVGATNAALNLTAVTAGMDANRYRVHVFSCSSTPITSAGAILSVNKTVIITTSPANSTVCEGTGTSFSATVTGSSPSYQWQVSTNNGSTWINIAGATTNTLALTNVSNGMNGNQYRMQTSGTCSATPISSAAAKLTVNALVAISTQPLATEVCAGLNASYSVNASGAGLSYQWQVSTNGGSSFTNIAGATSTTLTLSAVTVSMNGNIYRAVLTGTCNSITSVAASLTVNTPVVITTQPQDVQLCAGTNATFGITATGISITYQWQVSVNGGPFFDIASAAPYSGVNAATLQITNATVALSGNRYRVVASGVPCGGVTSTAAALVVNQPPVVVLTLASFANITPYVRTGIYTTISPRGTYTYKWFKNGVITSKFTNAYADITVDDFGSYAIEVTDVNGCSSRSNTVTVADSASNQLFIYPNPNRGKFQVRYYNQGGYSIDRTVVIYDARGAKVYSKRFTTSAIYGLMDVDISNASAGVFMVTLQDKDGKRLQSGKVIVQAH